MTARPARPRGAAAERPYLRLVRHLPPEVLPKPHGMSQAMSEDLMWIRFHLERRRKKSEPYEDLLGGW